MSKEEDYGFKPLDSSASSEDYGFKPLTSKKSGGKIGRTLRQAAGGATEGVLGTPGELLSLIPGYDKTPSLLPGHQKALEAEYDLPNWLSGILSDDDIAPRYSRFPRASEIAEALELEEPNNFVERAVRRGARNVGAGAATGVGSLLGLGSLGAGGVGGQGVEELTHSPLAGLLADVGLSIAPSAFLKNSLATSGKVKKAVETAKARGLTEKEIAPALTGSAQKGLIKSLGKKRTAAKISEKSRKAIGEIFDEVKDEARSLHALSPKEQSKLVIRLKDLRNSLTSEGTLKSPDTEHVIKQLDKLIEGSYSKKFRPIDLITDYEELNKIVNWNKVSNGKNNFKKIKSYLKGALEKEDPALARDFEDANLLYTKIKKFQNGLGKDLQNTLDKGEELGLLYAVGKLKPVLALKILGVDVGRKALTHYLLSPRGQGLVKKGLQAAKANRPQQLIKINELIEKDLKKRSNKSQSTPHHLQ